jgi:glycerol-3-phosphate dehydrogenase (NAD(P)+)
VVEGINRVRENIVFLPAVPLSPVIRATGTLADLTGCGMLLVVPPAQHLRAVLAGLPPI